MADLDQQQITANQTEPTRFWSLSGRIGRLRYLAYSLGAVMVVVLMMLAMFAFSMLLGSGEISRSIALIGAFGGVLFYIVFTVSITSRRTRDMGWPLWTTVLAFLPLVSLVWNFKAGTPGTNRYGPPSQPDSLGIKVAAFGFIIAIIASSLLSAVIKA